MLRPLRIAITSGDATGIGPEVVAKALRQIGPKKNVQYILWRNSDFPKRDLLQISKSFRLVTVGSWAEALRKMPSSPKEILDICGSTNPAIWVEEAASACFFKHLDAMATAPLSKPAIQASGMKDLGHTDILKRIAHVNRAYMAFMGKEFNVMLASGHTPLRNVADKISAESMTAAIKAAHRLSGLLQKTGGDKKKASKPIGVLGLNPHAGDAGLIGSEEDEILTPLIEKLRAEKIPVEGPLVPDSAFTPGLRGRYNLFLALYHDQGLIPFKAVHGQNGVHMTWGLPFVRTSVDHGTAFDIAGQNKADPTSMRLAIEWAIKLCSSFDREEADL
jgi:4-hydroxythreonine-4-phosphate dehydrogenase